MDRAEHTRSKASALSAYTLLYRERLECGFLLVCVCRSDSRATLRLPDLYQDSLQGDARVAELFSRLGVSTTYHEKYVELTRTSACVEELTNDFTNQPDLAQTFVVTCALLGIRFRFSGLQSLKIKETDRMAALIKEMKNSDICSGKKQAPY